MTSQPLCFQFPDSIRDLEPITQLYVSVDASTRDSLKAIDRPLFKVPDVPLTLPLLLDLLLTLLSCLHPFLPLILLPPQLASLPSSCPPSCLLSCFSFICPPSPQLKTLPCLLSSPTFISSLHPSSIFSHHFITSTNHTPWLP